METFLTIFSWIAVILFAGSFLYSSKFHLGNYLLQRKRIKNSEDKIGDEVYKHMHEKTNWKMLILFQVIKLGIVIMLLYFLL